MRSSSAAKSGATNEAPHLADLIESRPHEPVIHRTLASGPAVVEVSNFSLWYGEKQALFDVSFRVPARKVTALIGPSGCGKSTLLRSVNRLNDVIPSVRSEGEILFAGRSIHDRQLDVIELRKKIGMVFQKPNPFPKSIIENVAYPLRLDGETRRAVVDELCEKALRAVGLWGEVKDRLGHSALGLSGGQQQRLCIARAIVAEPEMLLMDEPCSALDPIATSRIEELMGELVERYTILIVTHNMQQASRTSDYTAFMYLGRLVEYGPTGEIFGRPRVEATEAYISGRFG